MANYQKNYQGKFTGLVTDRGYLLTELPNPLSNELDQLKTNQLVNLFNQEDKKPQQSVADATNEISNAIDQIVFKIRRGGKLFYIGAGTSGRLGVLDAAECPPTFCTPPDLVQGVIAGGDEALISSAEGIEDDFKLGREDLQKRNFSENDCLIGIMAGGTTPYVHGALTYAQHISALTVSICCVSKENVTVPCDIDIRLLTGPELLTGSTRLKAGTATKMALNIISTSVMIKLGKVFKNRMIDLKASNNKLLDRSLRILSDIANLNRKDGFLLLEKCDGSVKLALFVALSHLSLDECRKILNSNNDNLSDSLDSLNISKKKSW